MNQPNSQFSEFYERSRSSRIPEDRCVGDHERCDPCNRKGMQSRASAPIMKTMGVRIFQRRMAKQVGDKLHACSAFSRGCRHVKKDLWYSDTGRKQADILNMRMSPFRLTETGNSVITPRPLTHLLRHSC